MNLAEKTLAVILGGGAGTRLYPLTQNRSKPAVPIAGKFRLIDIPISNCLNSGINRMFVLTQYNSVSLNRHVKNAYHFDLFTKGFVEILAAEQTSQSKSWFQGTADAVRQMVKYLINHDFDHVLILSGDQLYQMDFAKILEFHKSRKADVTVATIPVIDKDATAFGIMKVDEEGFIDSFVEKPPMDELERWKSPLPSEYTDKGKHYLASMGIYVFTRGVLTRLFKENPESVDFGKEIIPYAVENDAYTTASYPYGGYWTDIGNIMSFFEANLELTDYLPAFNLYDNVNRIFTNARMLSPSKVFGTQFDQSLVSEGCIIHAKLIKRSVIGIRSRIGNNTVIESCYVMGIDYYQTLKDLDRHPDLRLMGIGDNCTIKNTIIDKNVTVGTNSTIIGDPSLKDEDTDEYAVRDGIIILKKGAVIPPDTTIGLGE